MTNSIVMNKSKKFAIRIIRLYQYLTDKKREYVISKQLLRSGTGIGANICEALKGQSKKDFVAKFHIALKEACESEYCIELLYETDYLKESEFTSIMSDCGEINKLLISIIKSTKKLLTVNC